MPTDTTTIDTSFTLCDEHTVKKLLQEDPQLLPNYPEEKAVNRGIDLAYGKEQISASVTSGILQGKSIPDIANDLQNRIETMNRNSAIRVARTACTEAENAGRLDSFLEAQGMGIDLQKQWMATSDSRTRPTHAEANGQTVDIDKPFTVGGEELMFPGDPSGSPAEIYNCRCTMVSVLKQEEEKPAEVEGEEPEKEVQTPEKEQVIKDLESKKIKYKEVRSYKGSRTEDEIIKRVGGPDKTAGSCSSLALTYIADKHGGYDVLDFRGGNSQDFFSRPFNINNIMDMKGVDSITERVWNEQRDSITFLNDHVKQGKEYYFTVADHAAVVRKNESGGLEYLELQKNDELNGFHELNSSALKHRFKATKQRTSYGTSYQSKVRLIEADSLVKSSEYKNMMGYINTDAEAQNKGAGGGAK